MVASALARVKLEIRALRAQLAYLVKRQRRLERARKAKKDNASDQERA